MATGDDGDGEQLCCSMEDLGLEESDGFTSPQGTISNGGRTFSSATDIGARCGMRMDDCTGGATDSQQQLFRVCGRRK
eukprot:m.107285 g.107285  ORF g.107285 m.107285 type:complete len:78 (-) comp15842_c1_seq2:44-277(-)